MLRLAAAAMAALLSITPAGADDSVDAHWGARLAMIQLHALQIPAGGVDAIVLGDSHSESFYWTKIGTCDVVNAGFGWGRIDTLAARAAAIANYTRPEVVHLMIGGNDIGAWSSDPATWPLAQANIDLQTIFDAFAPYGSKFVVWPIPPVGVEVGATYPLDRRAALNSVLASKATQNGARWDWWWPNTITQGPNVGGVVTNGWAIPRALIADHLHFAGSTNNSRRDRIAVWHTTLGISCP